MKRNFLLGLMLCLCIISSGYADKFGTEDNRFEIECMG